MPDSSRGAAESWARLRLRLDYAEMALHSGSAREALDGAVAVRDAPGVTSGLHWEARHLEGLALEAVGRLDPAVMVLRDVVDRVPDSQPRPETAGVSTIDDDRRAWIVAVLALSRCLRLTGSLREAVAVGDRAAPQIAAWGLDGSTEAIKLQVTVAGAHYLRGDLSHASRLCLRALETADGRGDPEARAAALWNTGIFESARGHQEVALDLLGEALVLFVDGEDARNQGRLRTQVGWALLRQNPAQAEAALTQLELAEQDLLNSSAGVHELAVALLPRAHALLRLGRADEASAVATRLLSLVEGLVVSTATDVHADLLAEAHLIAAQVARVRGAEASAVSHLREARAAAARSVRPEVGSTGSGRPMAPRPPGDRPAGELWLAIATVSEQMGDLGGALTAHRTATDLLGRGYALVRPPYLTA